MKPHLPPDLTARAASYVGPAGYGNDRVGLRSWPEPLRGTLARGALEALSWSALFTTEAPRFARMDWLSRLGFLAAELLDLDCEAMPADLRDRTGVVLETRFGCLATDLRFLRTPKPSLFTYTLPSTVIGEICIRFRLRGPVLCLMSANDPGRRAIEAGATWIQEGDADGCLCLACEAVDADSAPLATELAGPPPAGWQARAWWIGRWHGDPTRQTPWEPPWVPRG